MNKNEEDKKKADDLIDCLFREVQKEVERKNQKSDDARAKIEKEVEKLSNEEIIAAVGPILSKACYRESKKEGNDLTFLLMLKTLIGVHMNSSIGIPPLKW